MASTQKVDVNTTLTHPKGSINNHLLLCQICPILTQLGNATSHQEQFAILSSCHVSLISVSNINPRYTNIEELRRINHQYARKVEQSCRRFQNPLWFHSVVECLITTANRNPFGIGIPSPIPSTDRFNRDHVGGRMYLMIQYDLHQPDKKSLHLIFQPNLCNSSDTSEKYWRIKLRNDKLTDAFVKSTRLEPLEKMVVAPEVDLKDQIASVEIKELTPARPLSVGIPRTTAHKQITLMISVSVDPSEYNKALEIVDVCTALENMGQVPRISIQAGLTEANIACWILGIQLGRNCSIHGAVSYLVSLPSAKFTSSETNESLKHREIMGHISSHKQGSNTPQQVDEHFNRPNKAGIPPPPAFPPPQFPSVPDGPTQELCRVTMAVVLADLAHTSDIPIKNTMEKA